jgi:chaperonin GroES
MGEVVAVGPGAYDEHGEKRMPMEVKVGDRVLYKKWGSEEIKMDREEMMLIKQSDIMAIVS